MDQLPSNPDFPRANSSPPVIPDHQLLRCIGRGSYGEVYLARNLIGSFRAVKVVHRKTFVHSRPYDRELAGIRKFEPVSRAHEGFVDLLHVGSNDAEGYFYYIMELGDDLHHGRNIDPETYVPKTVGRLAGLTGRLSLDASLQLGLSLTNALAYLHKQGLVHRDIKPSNIIFVDGVPKLADVGLVARVDDEHSYVGTEGFIPLEGPGAPPADIYSLGKVLYEISTGKDRHDFPELPTILDQIPDTDRFLELNEVILHACKTDVKKRYQTAAEMHADLILVDNGGSVKRLKLLERRLATFKRTAGVATVGILVLAVIAFEVYRGISLAAEARQRQVGSKLTRGLAEMEAGHLLEALPPLVDALRLDQGEHETLYRMRIGAVLKQTPKLVNVWFGTNTVLHALFSPDGRRVLIAQKNGRARVYDSVTREPVSPFFGQQSGLFGAAFDPTGNLVATTSQFTPKSAVCIWDSKTGELKATLPHPERVSSAIFSPDGNQIVTSCSDGIVRVWNWRTSQIDYPLKGHTAGVLYAAFSPNGKFIVSCGRDLTARIWDVATHTQIGPPMAHKSWVNHVAFSPDSTKIVTAGLDNKACVWELGLKNTVRKLMPDLRHLAGVYTAEFSPDGLLIVTSCLDGTVQLWDATTLLPLPVNSVLRHGSPATSASFASDAHRLITTCWDGTVRIWDLAGSSLTPTRLSGSVSLDGSRYLTQSGASFIIRSTASNEDVALIPGAGPTTEAKLNRNGKFATILRSAKETNQMGQLQIWDVSKGSFASPPIPVKTALTNIVMSNHGQLVAIIAGNSVRLVKLADGNQLQTTLQHDDEVKVTQFSPNDGWLAIAGGNWVSVWKIGDEDKPKHRFHHDFPVGFVTFSQDSEQLVTGCNDNQLNVASAQTWNVMSGKPVGSPLQHTDGVVHGTFSPDGKRVVTAGEDFIAMIWDAQSGRPLASPLRHSDQVWWVAFSPDGKRLLTVCRNKTARIWDAETGEPLSPELLHPELIHFAGFAGDGVGIVTANKDGSIWLWNSHPDQHSMEDLSSMSQLLAGLPDPVFGRTGVQSMEARRAEWNTLITKNPSDFAVTTEELISWHFAHATFSQEGCYWSSALFHLNKLVELKPENEIFRTRLREVREELKNAESP